MLARLSKEGQDHAYGHSKIDKKKVRGREWPDQVVESALEWCRVGRMRFAGVARAMRIRLTWLWVLGSCKITTEFGTSFVLPFFCFVLFVVAHSVLIVLRVSVTVCAGVTRLVRSHDPDPIRLDGFGVRVRVGGVPVPHVVAFFYHVIHELHSQVRAVPACGVHWVAFGLRVRGLTGSVADPTLPLKRPQDSSPSVRANLCCETMMSAALAYSWNAPPSS